MLRVHINRFLPFFTACLICSSLTLDAKVASVIEQAPQSGGYAFIHTLPGSTVEFTNTQYQVDSKGYVAIGFNRNLSGPHALTIISPTGEIDIKEFNVAARTYNIQRVEGVPSSRVIPPAKKEVTDRIQADSAKVKQARAIISNFDYWRLDQFIWPVKGPISGVYGSQRFYNGTASSPHWGVDLVAPKGTAVQAPAGGKIVLAEEDLYYSGGTIILDHGAGVSSTFLHLSGLNVSVGQLVTKGEIIGAVGSTGRSTGPHLDWRMNINGVRVDAALWVDEP